MNSSLGSHPKPHVTDPNYEKENKIINEIRKEEKTESER